MKTVGDTRFLERLLRISPLARSLPPESQKKIVFRIGSDGCGSWENPETRLEYGLIDFFNSGAAAGFRRSHSMMPFEYLEKTGSDFDWTIYGENVDKQKSLTNDYVQYFAKMRDAGLGLFIFSQAHGAGKTLLSCVIANELMKRYPAYDFKFVTLSNLIELAKAFEDEQRKDELRKLHVCSFLILDGIDSEVKRGWAQDTVFRLLENRRNQKQITVFTSCVPIEKLKLDTKIASLIAATSYTVCLPAVDLRGKMAEEHKRKILEEARLEGR